MAGKLYLNEWIKQTNKKNPNTGEPKSRWE